MPRGKIPKSTELHLIHGTYRQDRHGGGGGGGRAPSTQRLRAKDRPAFVKGRAARIWAEVQPRLWWLRKIDRYSLAMWCVLQADFEGDPAAMRPARLSILRLLANDIGITAPGRARLGVTMAPPAEPGNDPYFDT